MSGKPVCNLSESDGNVFVIIGKVHKALSSTGLNAKAREFSAKAMAAGSYDEVLRLCFDYVDVK